MMKEKLYLESFIEYPLRKIRTFYYGNGKTCKTLLGHHDITKKLLEV